MRSKISKVTAALPVIGMAAACVTYVAGMFPISHNDTVPLFSLFFASLLSAAGLALTVVAVFCVIGFCKYREKRRQLIMVGLILLCALAFAGLCLLCYGGESGRIIAGFCVTEGVLSALTAVLCMLSPAEREQD